MVDAFCINPIYLKSVGYVPCGKCLICQDFKKREWIKRCYFEFRTSPFCYFLTLTLNDDNLNNVNYHSIQNFLKLLRLKSGAKFKYFGVFERGLKFGRPHFHLCIFSKSIIDNYLFNDCWKFGFIKLEELNYNAIRYVVGYTLKKFAYIFNNTFDNKFVKQYSKYSTNDKLMVRQTYYFMSKGLGFEFCFNHLNNILDDLYISVDGFKYSPPRSFLLKIGVRVDRNFSFNDEFFKDYDKFHNKIESKYNLLRSFYEKKKVF